MERMNAAATMYGWPVQLAWSGFIAARRRSADALDAPPAVEDSLRTLLRRFVSREWIDERMAQLGRLIASRSRSGSDAENAATASAA